MLRFALTIFTSAFLLFQVQPLIARFILPWFGGTPAVWSTCMLFFQLVLLAGYSYAHLLNHFFKPRKQAMIHLVVVVAACLLLPIIPNDRLRPSGEESPVLQILLVLSATIGLPYFVVSTTGPLLQSWFATTYPGRSPYRLFALSNFGSLVALLTYPFVFEPYLQQNDQAYSWSWGFILFALCCGWCALMIYADKRLDAKPEEKAALKSEKPSKYSDESKPNVFRILLWIALAMVPSLLLLATTNQVCQEIAVVPFLWVIPLALYLITFIICFEAPYLYIRLLFYPLFGLFIIVALVCLGMGVDAPMWLQAGGLILSFFFSAMVCHGELACIKPDSKYLTLYYLAISVGGALGGIFVVLVAPLLFNGYYELHVGMILSIVLTAIAFHSRTDNSFFRFIDYRISVGVAAILTVGLCIPVYYHARVVDKLDKNESIIFQHRDFWGIITVKQDGADDDEERMYQLTNGRINHGNQYVDEKWRMYKTTYYCKGSGIGLAVTRHPKRFENKGLTVGVVGLGTGTVAAWAAENDYYRFYEINPTVKKVAEEIFFYLRGARKVKGVEVDVVLGDARIQLQRELDNSNIQKFDVLGVDAFSSDAIPRHLLTLECIKLYEKHLAEGGIIAIHISNRFLDLEGICYRIGVNLGYKPIVIDCEPEVAWGFSNSWVLLTRNEAFLSDPDVVVATDEWALEWRKRTLKNFIQEKIDAGLKSTINLKDESVFDLKTPEALDQFEQLLKDEETLKEFTEKREAWEKADRQFDVLWTDDFGSLWQVIRLEFDLKKTWKEVKDWWKTLNKKEETEEDDDSDGEDVTEDDGVWEGDPNFF